MAQGHKAFRAWVNDAIVSFCGCDGSLEQQVRGGKDLYDLRIQTTVPLWGRRGGQSRTSGNSLKVDRLAFHAALPPTEELIPQSISTAGAIEDAAGQLAYS